MGKSPFSTDRAVGRRRKTSGAKKPRLDPGAFNSHGTSGILAALRRSISHAVHGVLLSPKAARHALALETAAEVLRAATSILEPDLLLRQVAELMRAKLNFYYVGIFTVDSTGELTGEPGRWAVLRAGAGDPGPEIVRQGNRLELAGKSMTSWCIANRQARLARDVHGDPYFLPHPKLPRTRSEMALPLISRGKVIGAMTIDAKSIAAFDEKDLAVFQTMADHVANALENARLFEQAQLEIAERKRAEEALAKEEYLLRTLLDSLPDAIYFKDRESRFIRISRTLADKFGLEDPGQAVGKSDFDYFTVEHAKAAYADEQEIIETGRPLVSYEEYETWPNRPGTWVSSSKAPLRDQAGEIVGTFGISRDITAQKQAQEALAKERNLLRSLIDHVPDYIYVKDKHGRFITANPAVARLLGVAGPEALMGKTDYDFFPPEMADAYALDEREILTSGRPLLEKEEPVIDKAGRKRWVSTIKVPLWDSQGKIYGLVGVGRDITEHKLIDARLEEQARELARSNEELEQFAYIASHDLQEPLRMIQGYVQLLAKRYRDKLDADANDFIDFAVDGASRMHALINDLLQYSRVGTRGKELKPTDCAAVLDAALANIKVALEECGAVVTFDALPVVIGDEVQLTQLFQNLIGNAVKFRREDTHPLIHMEVKAQADKWVFAVRDNGIGIEAKDFERIFKIFQRLHGAGDYPGTGIGLAVCKRIVERHGGKIWVESTPGKGSTFYFTLRGQSAADPGPK